MRINGIDIRRFEVADLRRHASAIFQDYVQFQFTARENILFGDIVHAEDARRMAQALQLSGADDVVNRLRDGLDTPLGRTFRGGEELSMGQWQRIALARQIYSEAPILLFDEPTAWMDIDTRNAFLQTLQHLKNERLIILVSHLEEHATAL